MGENKALATGYDLAEGGKGEKNNTVREWAEAEGKGRNVITHVFIEPHLHSMHTM